MNCDVSMAIKQISKRSIVNFVIGLSFIAVVGLYFVQFITADRRVKELCAEIRPGMRVVDVNQYAKSVGLGPPAKVTGTSFLVERRTFGRYGTLVHGSAP